MKEIIESNKNLEVTDNKGVIQLLINLKYRMIVMRLSSHFKVFHIP